MKDNLKIGKPLSRLGRSVASWISAQVIATNTHVVNYLYMLTVFTTGFGHAAQYPERERVTQYVALEPNAAMHKHIREVAGKAGYTEADGSLLILPYGLESGGLIHDALAASPPPVETRARTDTVDTAISLLSLCSVPRRSLDSALMDLTHNILAPGGQLLFLEHVLMPEAVPSYKRLRFYQHVLAPLWSVVFGGCDLVRDTVAAVRKAGADGVWDEDQSRSWVPPTEMPGESLILHAHGCFVKKGSV